MLECQQEGWIATKENACTYLFMNHMKFDEQWMHKIIVHVHVSQYVHCIIKDGPIWSMGLMFQNITK
jgi:hypothetical protein